MSDAIPAALMAREPKNRATRRAESSVRRKHGKKCGQPVEPKEPDEPKAPKELDEPSEAEESKLPEARAPPPKKLLKSAAVRQRLGDISSQTLWRFGRDPELGFPPPLYICGVRYWDASTIENFIEQRQRAAA